jgi:hypothetical protein
MKTVFISLLCCLVHATGLSQSSEKHATLVCQEIGQLIDFALKDFKAIMGEEDTSAKSKTYFSKQSFGIEGSTRIKITKVIEDVPSIEFTLYYGTSALRAQEAYVKTTSELNNCLTRIGFEKKVDEKIGRTRFDPITEITSYKMLKPRNTVVNVYLLDPLIHEMKDGKPTSYLPSGLVTVSVTHY